jgi:flavin reductase (DIM6/NTAB) family NADH-FMN oxidoreductase RutF
MTTQTETYFYETAKGHGLPHDPFKAIVAPRPIGWISTVDRDGQVNLAPYSFFNAVCGAPPIVAFSSESYKDSVRNAEATGEFVANFVSKPLAEAMNRTSAAVSPDTDEMTLAGLAAAPSRLVAPPRVAAAPAALECKLTQVIRLQTVEGKTLDTYLVLGQVVGVHIDPRFLRDGIFDLLTAQPVMRAGYRDDYVQASDPFKMVRPKA